MMFSIGDTLVSADLIESFFCCDLRACHGQCCIDGDSGAPLLPEEYEKLRDIYPTVRPYMTPGGQHAVDEQGPGYYDQEGDLVTTLVEGSPCAFATFGPDGLCLCGLEQAYREGKTDFCKPASCHLYPVRLSTLPSGVIAVNLHRWSVCKPARLSGGKKGVRAYQFLRAPLTARFGADWYAELCEVAEAWLNRDTNRDH